MLFCIYSSPLFCIFFIPPSFISILSLSLSPALSYYSPGASTRPLPPSRTSSASLIPRHLSLPSSLHCSASYLFLSSAALCLFFSHSLRLFSSMLTLPLAECSVGNRHLGTQLACWEIFSKNTAKGLSHHICMWLCGCAQTQTHSLFISLSSFRAFVYRGLHTGHASVSDMVLPSFRDKP